MSDLDAAVRSRLEAWTADRVAERLWAKDGSLWAESGKPPEAVAAWLGWLDLPDAMSARVAELEHLRPRRPRGRISPCGRARHGRLEPAPELFSRVFGWAGGRMGAARPRPTAWSFASSTRRTRHGARIPIVGRGAATLFVVSSKSGTTTEPNRVPGRDGRDRAGARLRRHHRSRHRPGRPGQAQEFRAIVAAPPDVGGRSALSVFGLVPAALHGVDLGGLLERARAWPMRAALDAAGNPGLRLGALIGEAAAAGRDKLTVLTGQRLGAFGDWAEQLVAESTGKAGPASCRSSVSRSGTRRLRRDRCFVRIRLAGENEPELDALADALEAAGHRSSASSWPIRSTSARSSCAGRWRPRVAGIVLGIDPFDQPNVQESKDATTALLDAYRERGALPVPMPIVSEPGAAVTADPRARRRAGQRRRRAGPPDRPGPAGIDYVAILAYVPMTPEIGSGSRPSAPASVRRRGGDDARLRAALPPLHRALHKGGPDTGVFLQLTAEPSKDLPIRAGRDVRHAHRRAGARRPRVAAEARPAGDAPPLRPVEAGLSRLEAMVGAALSVWRKKDSMQVAIAGLGRMGPGWRAGAGAGTTWSVEPDRVGDRRGRGGAENEGRVVSRRAARAAREMLAPPRHVVISVPSGDATDALIEQLAGILEPGDVIVDAGNSRFHDSRRHAAELEAKGLDWLDMGVSGGIWGLEVGFCAMLGGKREVFERFEPVVERWRPRAATCTAARPGPATT